MKPEHSHELFAKISSYQAIENKVSRRIENQTKLVKRRHSIPVSLVFWAEVVEAFVDNTGGEAQEEENNNSKKDSCRVSIRLFLLKPGFSN